MKFYDAAKPSYLVTDVSGISFGAGYIQVRDGMNDTQDETPDNVMFRPITFASKSLSNIERLYNSRIH